MVSAWFLTKVFVAFAPLSVVYAQQYNVSVPVLPSLLDATADELIAGLDAGSFTSLDLVQVRIKRSASTFNEHTRVLVSNVNTGLCRTHYRSKQDPSHGRGDQP
jgi:hypothetical protein